MNILFEISPVYILCDVSLNALPKPGKCDGYQPGPPPVVQPERVHAAAGGRGGAGGPGLHPRRRLHHGRRGQLLLRSQLPHGAGAVYVRIGVWRNRTIINLNIHERLIAPYVWSRSTFSYCTAHFIQPELKVLYNKIRGLFQLDKYCSFNAAFSHRNNFWGSIINQKMLTVHLERIFETT